MMNQSELEPQIGEIVEITWPERWQVYLRLQELGIPCCCAIDQPLRVQVNNATAAVQLQSVLKQLTTPRVELASWLDGCWQLSCKKF